MEQMALQFKLECLEKLTEVFTLKKQGKAYQDDRLIVMGMIHAGVRLGLFTREQMHAHMESIYRDIFGCTIAESSSRKKEVEELKKTDPDAYLEIPTFERNRL